MSNFVLTDVTVSLSGVNVTSFIRSVSLNRNIDAIESSCMGSTSREYVPGVDSFEGTLNFAEDFAAAGVNETLSNIFAGGIAVALAVRPTSGVISATNPEFQGNVIVTNAPMIDGDWGSLAEVGISFQGTGVLTRDVTP